MALSSDVARMLSEQFEQREMNKTYPAVVRGYLEGEVVIDYALTPELDKLPINLPILIKRHRRR